MSQSIASLCFEHHHGNVRGIETEAPRLSWTYVPGSAPESWDFVRVTALRSCRGTFLAEESTTVPVDANVLLDWPFPPAGSSEHIEVHVRLERTDGSHTPDLVGSFEPWLLNVGERVADMVGPAWPEPWTDFRHAPLIRCETTVAQRPTWARLYLSSYGLVDAEINGQRVGEDVLTPGWTDYRNRLTCWTYDVTGLLRTGDNVLGFWLGDGWYRGRLGWDGGEPNVYGDRLGVWAQLEMAFEDGTTRRVFSNSYDGHWFAAKGPIVRSGLYRGERYDARLEYSGWSSPGFIQDGSWERVTELKFDPVLLHAPQMEAVRKIGTHQVESIRRIGEGRYLLDFGQNCTQRLRLSIPQMPSGDVVTIRHAEVLEPDGSLAIKPLREAEQMDTFTSAGEAAEWEPRFTMHAFRYATISGWKGDLDPSMVDCRVYGSVLQRTGWLNTSHEMLNQLHSNVRWSMLSNFVSIPTDCPQRDERLGWTGDIAMFAPTASFLYDVSAFLSNWLVDVEYDTHDFGTVPGFVPFVPVSDWRRPASIAIWGDSVVLVPWAIYMESGDRQLLERQYPLAEYWVNQVSGYLSEDGVWDRRPELAFGQLGDWLDPSAPIDNPTLSLTEQNLVATAFCYQSACLVAKMSEELHRHDDAERYRHLAEHVREGFLARFVDGSGRMTSDTECAYALAIMFGLLDDSPALLLGAGDRLSELAVENRYRVSTGFAGTPYVLPALTRTGHVDAAYRMILNTQSPSWLYEVSMGATTTWERWDAMLPDGTLNPSGMTSFNHYALGAVADWMHCVIGGIRALQPGWKEFEIAPKPGGGITSAHVSHASPYGVINVSWRIADDSLIVDAQVPFGTCAVIGVQQGEERLPSGTHHRKYAL